MKEAVDIAVQLQTNKLREEAQAKNEDFLNQVDTTMKKIIKDQVKAQVSKIMPKVEKYVTASPGAEVLVRSKNQFQIAYAVAASLSELELKKILMDKMEANKSIERSNTQRTLYNVLVASYNSNKDIISSYGDVVLLKRGHDDKDKDQDPSAGSDRGMKRRRIEEPSHNVQDTSKHQDQDQAAQTEEPPALYDEFNATTFDFSTQNQRDLPRDIPLDSVEVLRYNKRSNSEIMEKVSIEMELVLEQTQQGSSHEVLVSVEGVEELKRNERIKGVKKEALHTLKAETESIHMLSKILMEASKRRRLLDHKIKLLSKGSSEGSGIIPESQRDLPRDNLLVSVEVLRLELYLDHLDMDLSEYLSQDNTTEMDVCVSKRIVSPKKEVSQDEAEGVKAKASTTDKGIEKTSIVDSDYDSEVNSEVDSDDDSEYDIDKSVNYLSPSEEELIKLRNKMKANREVKAKECQIYYALANGFSLWYEMSCGKRVGAKCGQRPPRLSDPNKDGWKAWCRKVIALDDRFLKSPNQGEILTASGRDGIDHIYPMAWAVAASKASYPELFHKIMDKIKSANPNAHNYLVDKNPKTWSRAFFEVNRGYEVVKNGFSECFNSVIISVRHKPLITMVKAIRVIVLERINKMRKISMEWNPRVCPSIKNRLEWIKEQQRSRSEGFTVDEGKRTCSCRTRQLSGILCVYSIKGGAGGSKGGAGVGGSKQGSAGGYKQGSADLFEVRSRSEGFPVDEGKRTCGCRTRQLSGILCVYSIKGGAGGSKGGAGAGGSKQGSAGGYKQGSAELILIFCPKVEMSRDVLTVGSTMRIPLLYQGEYSQWVERFMNYLEEQTDGEAMINSIKNGDQPLPRVIQVSIAGTTLTEQPSLKDKSMWFDQEKRV
uniref:Multidrug resistance-associated protein 5 n=1 Tax=Tanacetum cinerariifolium TaxID=118510 RepID=A0A6L2JED3_TANCI|nr:multidrug resistance-associated protein 5 [Tanacetum cinerariifolium]